MNLTTFIPSDLSRRVRQTAIVAIIGSCACSAAEDLRIVPQLLGGTAGIEPGVALEWRSMDLAPIIVRPEFLISEDGRPGGGGAVLWDITTSMNMRGRQALAIGPRVVYHNSDEKSWEFDGMATWSYDLTGGIDAWRHSIGALAAVGIVHDKEDDENQVGITGGLFYSYRF